MNSMAVNSAVNPMAYGVRRSDITFNLSNLKPLKVANVNAVINPAFSQLFTGLAPWFPIELLSDELVTPPQYSGRSNATVSEANMILRLPKVADMRYEEPLTITVPEIFSILPESLQGGCSMLAEHEGHKISIKPYTNSEWYVLDRRAPKIRIRGIQINVEDYGTALQQQDFETVRRISQGNGAKGKGSGKGSGKGAKGKGQGKGRNSSPGSRQKVLAEVLLAKLKRVSTLQGKLFTILRAQMAMTQIWFETQTVTRASQGKGLQPIAVATIAAAFSQRVTNRMLVLMFVIKMAAVGICMDLHSEVMDDYAKLVGQSRSAVFETYDTAASSSSSVKAKTPVKMSQSNPRTPGDKAKQSNADGSHSKKARRDAEKKKWNEYNKVDSGNSNSSSSTNTSSSASNQSLFGQGSLQQQMQQGAPAPAAAPSPAPKVPQTVTFSQPPVKGKGRGRGGKGKGQGKGWG